VSLITERARSHNDSQPQKKPPLRVAFFWLGAFYFIYCARPEDWVKALGYAPMAKITAIMALFGLFFSMGKTPRRLSDLPREAVYLLIMIALLFVSALFSPIWRGGAFFNTLNFSKMYVAWVLTFLLITTHERLRRIISIQALAVAAVSAIAIVKGHSVPRLNGVIGGVYSNPNDLAFAIVLNFPFCLAFFVRTKQLFRRMLWGGGMLMMGAALVLTASRAGFIDFLISGTVCLWHFGIKGRRLYLIVSTVFIGTLLLLLAGGRLKERFYGLAGSTDTEVEDVANGSYEERRELMVKSLEGIAHYPILGMGMNNFMVYSGHWKEVHAVYLQIAVEGGIPVLILFLLFLKRGFANLNELRRMRHLDVDTKLFVGALHSSLIGFVVGACFAPEAYQYFTYFAICYTSVLFAIVKEREKTEPASGVWRVQNALSAEPTVSGNVYAREHFHG